MGAWAYRRFFSSTHILPNTHTQRLHLQGFLHGSVSDGTPTMLVECKPAETELTVAEAAPLLRALQETEARVGILTNGIEYHFFSDRQTAPDAPFFTFNLLRYSVPEVEALQHLREATLDIDGFEAAAWHDPGPSSGSSSGSTSGSSFNSWADVGTALLVLFGLLFFGDAFRTLFLGLLPQR